MLIYLLDENFEMMSPTDLVTSLRWNVKYYDAGSFTLHLSVSQKQIDDGTLGAYRKAAYVYVEQDGYTGIIQQHEYQTGKYIMRGRTLERLLNERVVNTQFSMTGKAEDIARAAVDKFAINPTDQSQKIPNLYLGNYNGLGENISYSQRGKHLDECVGEILYTRELSYRLRHDFAEKRIYFEVFQGTDRTQNQNINMRAVFSKELGNIKDQSEIYTYSNNYRNFAYVAGAGEGDARTVVAVNRVQPGEKIKELWVDARDLQPSDSSYSSQLISRGEQKLSEYQQIESVQFDIQATDNATFSIGDICEYVNNDLNIVMTGRITEINGVWEAGVYQQSIILGEELLGIPQIVKRELS